MVDRNNKFSRYRWIGRPYGNWGKHNLLKPGEEVFVQAGSKADLNYASDKTNWQFVGIN
jgi:hypothetical protein